MTVVELIDTCECDLLFGFYQPQAKMPEEEIRIKETDDFAVRKKMKERITGKYPGAFVDGIWCLDENTIAAHVMVNYPPLNLTV